MSARNIEALHSQYSGAPQRVVRVSPEELGMRRIGHIGFFVPGREQLWQQLLLPELALAGP